MKENKFTINIKVEYSHTDKMEYVHHSQYLIYYEYARLEFFRKYCISYKEIEEEGILMPVISAKLKYIKPAYYDDELKIGTTFKNDGAKLIFQHEITNGKNELINTGVIHVVCIDRKTRKLLKPSKNILNLISLNVL